MNVQVETFECSETAAEPIEAGEEALGIIESLGLKGQQTLTAGPENKSRVPYREITKDEDFVYRFMCPKVVALKDYAASPIPLRVLQIASHAQSLDFFKELFVLDRESAAVPDPVLIATAPGVRHEWQTRTYILARWGETLETFSTLLTRAIDQKREQLKRAVLRCKDTILAEVARVESMQDDAILELGPHATAEFNLR